MLNIGVVCDLTWDNFALINNKFKNKTVQKVLISRSKPTIDLVACGFFYRIIDPEEFFWLYLFDTATFPDTTGWMELIVGKRENVVSLLFYFVVIY